VMRFSAESFVMKTKTLDGRGVSDALDTDLVWEKGAGLPGNEHDDD